MSTPNTSPRPRVLLTNDDGPPSKESPYIYGLYRHLTQDLGWDVKVVIPSSQKSWIGKAYQIHDIVKGRYYYPSESSLGYEGEISEESRPLKEGEIAEWVLLDGTPATCSNIGIHNLYHGEIDLLISGPNLGRNSSAAFVLSSGTIGAALSSSLSKVRSIALSYGTVAPYNPLTFSDAAHRLSARIISHLWANWGTDMGGLRRGEVDLYNINLPMIDALHTESDLPICWTRIWRNSYGRLFKAYAERDPALQSAGASTAGPDSPDADPYGKTTAMLDERATPKDVGGLVFKFGPDLSAIIDPAVSDVPVGTDGWAIRKGWVSITPMRATFAEPVEWVVGSEEEHEANWKLKSKGYVTHKLLLNSIYP